MFGFRFWPYLPRIWVSPQEATPGFNVNEDDVPQSAAAMEIPSSSTSPPPEREFMIETGPLAELPGFRLYPQLDISGFNVGADSLPSQSTVQPDAALDGALPTPKRALVAQSAPRWGLPGFGVQAQQNAPGFNVGRDDEALAFNPDERDDDQQEPTWSEAHVNLPPDLYQPPTQHGPTLPVRLYSRVIPPRLPSTIIDPIARQGIAANRLPAESPSQALASIRWPSLSVARRSPAAQQTTGEKATLSDWPRLQDAEAAPGQNAGLSARRSNALLHPRALPAIPAIRPIAVPQAGRMGLGSANDQPARVQMPHQSITSPTSHSTAIGVAGPGLGSAQNAPQSIEAYPPRRTAGGAEDKLSETTSGFAEKQTEKSQAMAEPELSAVDAAGLPNGAIISAAQSPEARSDADKPKSGVGSFTGDPNLHLVESGDGPNQRHNAGVAAAIAVHMGRGFELVIGKTVAVDVPGASSPRFYDYIIRDPVTGRSFGVEVKTTIGSTIRLDRDQVMKDAIVATKGAKVRSMDVTISGVSYMTYCFGCDILDVRSRVLQAVLRSANVQVRHGSLPGQLPPR